jgi:hypothetical protein
MKTLEDYLTASEHATYHRSALQEFSETQRQVALEMAQRLEAAGCIDPLPWVMSELRENIAQTARFGVLRELFLATQRTPGLLNEIAQHDQHFKEIQRVISAVIPEADLEYFVRALCKSFGFDLFMILDDGSPINGMPSWALKELDASGHETGRFVAGLHEDYEDFALQDSVTRNP